MTREELAKRAAFFKAQHVEAAKRGSAASKRWLAECYPEEFGAKVQQVDTTIPGHWQEREPGED